MNPFAFLGLIVILIFGVVLMPVLNGVGKYEIKSSGKTRGGRAASNDGTKRPVRFGLTEGTSTALRQAKQHQDNRDNYDSDADDDSDGDNNHGQARLRSRRNQVIEQV
ncbi:hypothetical protein V1514DRAFT_321962 [Lipomyces japonicus]|uniref:uncharacterized protein n=1 Tax=Lipomyces japonicus TaxID=56871 RepID=UPI0034CD662D